MVMQGRRLAVLVGLVPPVVAVAGAAGAGWHWLWIAAGFVAGLGIGFAIRVFAELTDIIADMLLPE